jgi:TonB family protein
MEHPNMKCLLHLTIAALLWYGVVLLAQTAPPSTERKPESPASSHEKQKPPSASTPKSATSGGPVEVLSDTHGVNFDPYLRQVVVPAVRKNWYTLIPESAKMKKGELSIEFHILKDGRVADMKTVEASGEADLDRAAYGGIMSSNPFPPLPGEFTGNYLALRFHFYYNPDRDVLILTELRISPISAQVVSGRNQQFSTSVTGTTNKAVSWSVLGAGCDGTACGTISADGLYTAPLRVPDPPTVTVTATLAADQTAIASAVITIVQLNSPR